MKNDVKTNLFSKPENTNRIEKMIKVIEPAIPNARSIINPDFSSSAFFGLYPSILSVFKGS